MTTQVIIGILIPFAGTSLGAAMVFFLKDSISKNLQRILTGFAAGVMVAASFWSLLEPALESSESMGKLSFVPAAVGFLVGIGFLLVLDMVTPHMHMNKEGEGPQSGLKRTTKLILAVTLHNIPEGTAVGYRYRYSELPGRRHRIHAAQRRGHFQGQDLLVRSVVRSS